MGKISPIVLLIHCRGYCIPLSLFVGLSLDQHLHGVLALSIREKKSHRASSEARIITREEQIDLNTHHK